MSLTLSNDHVECVVQVLEEDTKLRIRGRVMRPEEFKEMIIMAPSPIDRRTSYSGSGLPFPCPSVALDNTPNRAAIGYDGEFDTTFVYPNSYYTVDATTKVPPSIFFVLVPQSEGETLYIRFELPENPTLFLRTLTHRPNRRQPASTGTAFYANKEHLMDPIPSSAEKVMRMIKQLKSEKDIAV